MSHNGPMSHPEVEAFILPLWAKGRWRYVQALENWELFVKWRCPSWKLINIQWCYQWSNHCRIAINCRNASKLNICKCANCRSFVPLLLTCWFRSMGLICCMKIHDRRLCHLSGAVEESWTLDQGLRFAWVRTPPCHHVFVTTLNWSSLTCWWKFMLQACVTPLVQW